MKRADGRNFDELRKVTIETGYTLFPEGSVLISVGDTRVLCNVTIEAAVPGWFKHSAQTGGWLTAEYALLPRSTAVRTARETSGLKGRTQEIRRLIGRSLRAAVDLSLLDGYTCIIDCDVIQADGGTRTASITGAYVALVQALQPLIAAGKVSPKVLKSPISAVSVGMLEQKPYLDLNYLEDKDADVDMNIVVNAQGEYIEIQGTAEGAAYARQDLNQLLNLAEKGCEQLLKMQQKALSCNPGNRKP